MLPTIIIASVIAILFIAVIVKSVIDKKNGKSSCSCGGSCGTCAIGCHSKTEN